MDIQLLKTFSFVARLGNITQAAELLNFTQPTVSAQIRTLEEHFGVQLFERLGKKLYITEAGKYLIDPAEKMLALYDETAAQLSSLSGVPVTRIGISTNYINQVLSPALLKWQASGAPGKISVAVCLNSKAVLQGINNNQFDLGLVHDPITEKYIETVPIHVEELVWCGHRKLLQGAACPRICDYPIINFRQGCTFRRLCDELLQTLGLTSTFEYSDFDAVKNAVFEGLGIAVLPRIVVENAGSELVVFDAATNLTNTVYAITRQDKVLSSNAQTLLKLLQEQI